LILTQLGRRFDTFHHELRRVRNQARVVGLLAHGISMPEVFPGALLSDTGPARPSSRCTMTHVTIVRRGRGSLADSVGAVTVARAQLEPPAVALETSTGSTTLGHLARRRGCVPRRNRRAPQAQRRVLAEIAGQSGFADGSAVTRSEVRCFEELLERFTAADRVACSNALLAAATREPRLGFVQLLNPDGSNVRARAAAGETGRCSCWCRLVR
jgi:hypothetical protein